ncbi:MAG: Bug family tripartite tricarboxylate transporter substrate binding protein [Oscillospiraceae bacterium]
MSQVKRILSVLLVATMVFALAACNSSNSAGGGKQETFPNKDITFLVPYSAGGSSDQMARVISNYSQKYLGVNMVIENVPGGGGNIGLNELASKNADGYYVGSANTSANLQPLYGQTEYDYLEIFEPIALCVSIPIAVTVPADSPFQTIEELIDFAKENPGKLQYGHAGVGSITHVTAELFAMEAGIEMTQVPFGSGADALTALLGSQIDIDVASLSEVLSHHHEGTARILALCTDTTVEGLDVPTLISKGYNVDMKVTQGIWTLKDVDPEVLKVLDEKFGEIIQDEDFQKELVSFGMDVDYLNAADFSAFLKEQRAVFERVVTESGILEMVKSQQK